MYLIVFSQVCATNRARCVREVGNYVSTGSAAHTRRKRNHVLPATRHRGSIPSMDTLIDPIFGNWYRHLDKGQMFMVVAVDESDSLVELQHFDGDVEEQLFFETGSVLRVGVVIE